MKKSRFFKYRIQKVKKGNLLSYKANDKCIANALCYVGSHRRQPICGNYASRVRDSLDRTLCREFTEKEMDSIVLAYMKDEDSDGIPDSFLPKEIVEKLSHWVPVFMSSSRSLKDYLDD